MPGVNYILNDQFQKQIGNKQFHNRGTIMDLVMIDLDSLIKFQDLFHFGKIKLNHAINNHLAYTHSSSIFDKISSFNTNIHDIAIDLNHKHPMLFDKCIKEILDEYSQFMKQI